MDLFIQIMFYSVSTLCCIYLIGTILQNFIFKALIFNRLKSRFPELWKEVGSPKFWALMENVEVINELHDYPYLYDEIKESDELLAFMVDLAVRIDTFMHQMIYPMLIVSLLWVFALKFAT